MKTILNGVKNTLVIHNSKFITYLEPLSCMEEIATLLATMKEKHIRATHICYAYRFMGRFYAFDDGEPKNTAGEPILQVLSANQLENVLCIVVRYFGGIKLGTGGLIRAYSSSAKEALHLSCLVELSKGVKVRLHFPYSLQKQVDYFLRNCTILEKTFLEQISYIATVPSDVLKSLEELSITVWVLEKCYITQKKSS